MSAFSNNNSRKDGKSSLCKQCVRLDRFLNRSTRLENDKKYRDKPEVRFKTYKASAASRGFLWTLNFRQFMTFWKKPCSHCGVDIETIGLDRVDSKVPYQMDNLEPCCSTCNRLKSDWSTADWYEHMDTIIQFRGEHVKLGNWGDI